MIAAPGVPLGEIGEFLAHSRRAALAGKLAQLARHVPVMVAVGSGTDGSLAAKGVKIKTRRRSVTMKTCLMQSSSALLWRAVKSFDHENQGAFIRWSAAVKGYG